uniref:Reverse transcriptase domain-containing protein n=1 Tax=Tanacetum cinerariifolium TaxID=118510 RepID=A0A6L2M0W8_TANCI|nr:hypothetical protein [Tanacetum cinerariifolium]
MRIDELHKFSDGTLNDVRNALNDRLKGIRMQYLPSTIWRKGDKDRAAAMIQAIEKMLKTRRIMRSLEKFVGGRLRVEDLQLGVESYQKKLNLMRPDTYRSDLKRREAYTAHSNPRGFIYHNKDKKNRLMRIDELHKFSDGTLNDVRNALDDHAEDEEDNEESGKVRWWKTYLPSTIWRKGDKDRAAAMIQAIEKMLKTRRIMRSLEKFVGGRLDDGNPSRAIIKQALGSNSLVHSYRALSTLRRFGLRMAGAAAKPCQGDSSKFYLIIGSIYTDQQGTVESDKLIKSSVEDLVPIPSESEDTSGSDSEYDLFSCDDFSPIDVPKGKFMTFSNPLYASNNDFTSSDDESLSDEDVPKDNVLENIMNKDSYDEPDLLVTPLFDANEDECFDPGDDVDEIELLLHRDPSTLKMSVASILEGFTNEPPLEENDDLFDLESKENKWKKILYDAPIDDLMTEDKVFYPRIPEKIFSPTYVRLPLRIAIIFSSHMLSEFFFLISPIWWILLFSLLCE